MWFHARAKRSEAVECRDKVSIGGPVIVGNSLQSSVNSGRLNCLLDDEVVNHAVNQLPCALLLNIQYIVVNTCAVGTEMICNV